MLIMRFNQSIFTEKQRVTQFNAACYAVLYRGQHGGASEKMSEERQIGDFSS